ncbi:NADPH-dependent FMN reductase [Cohnella sp. 56]|uniref:NADPH-dependent FMN reductase n=1 Tax=Cohnella sp. 56 TaxID=3113722 RepID=UPI0030E8882B
MKLIALVGSLRKESVNYRLALTLKERYQDRFELAIADIGSLPFFNQDEEEDPPASVQTLKNSISTADGVLILTPEFNWSIPGLLKNALDWLSRGDKVLIGKPVLVAGASPGMYGTLRGQLHLREILTSPGIQAVTLPPAGNEIAIAQAPQKFGDGAQGRLTDERTLNHIDVVVDRFLGLIGKS